MLKYFLILLRIITGRRSIFQSICHMLLMAVISFAISFVTIAPLVRYYQAVAFNMYSNYDVKIKYLDEALMPLANTDYVKSIVFNPMYNCIKTNQRTFRIINSQHINSDISDMISSKLYLNDLKTKSDKKAYINSFLSKELNLNAGDIITYETTINDVTYSFQYVINAILEDSILEVANATDYILLIQDDELYEKVKQIGNYTTTYIKYKDKNEVNKLRERIMSGEFNETSFRFESREINLLKNEDEPIYNLSKLILFSLSGTFALCLIFSHEKKKKYELNKTAIDTLYSIGARKLWLTIYMGATAFIEQLVITIGTIILIQKLFWQGGSQGYLSINLVTIVLPYYVIAMLIAAIYSAVAVTYGLGRKE